MFFFWYPFYGLPNVDSSAALGLKTTTFRLVILITKKKHYNLPSTGDQSYDPFIERWEKITSKNVFSYSKHHLSYLTACLFRLTSLNCTQSYWGTCSTHEVNTTVTESAMFRYWTDRTVWPIIKDLLSYFNIILANYQKHQT